MPIPRDRYDSQGWQPSNPFIWSIWVFIFAIIIGIALDQFVIYPQFQFRSSGSKPINNSNTNIPPTIMNVTVDYPSSTSVRIKWTTKQKTTSRVIYCRLDTSCGDSGIDTRFTTDHEVVINDLLPNTHYKITINSADADGNQIELELNNWVITPSKKT